LTAEASTAQTSDAVVPAEASAPAVNDGTPASEESESKEPASEESEESKSEETKTEEPASEEPAIEEPAGGQIDLLIQGGTGVSSDSGTSTGIAASADSTSGVAIVIEGDLSTKG